MDGSLIYKGMLLAHVYCVTVTLFGIHVKRCGRTIIGDSMVRDVDRHLKKNLDCRVFSYGGLDAHKLREKLRHGMRFPGRKFIFVLGTCMVAHSPQRSAIVDVLQ